MIELNQCAIGKANFMFGFFRFGFDNSKVKEDNVAFPLLQLDLFFSVVHSIPIWGKRRRKL